jgi:hypothetical protein
MVRRYKYAFCLEYLCNGPHFFVKSLWMKHKELSNFLDRQAYGKTGDSPQEENEVQSTMVGLFAGHGDIALDL